MTRYDASRFDPPAPVAEVTLRSPDGGRSVSQVLLLLDTGADITLLPRAAVERLGVEPLADVRYELMGFDGTASFAPLIDHEHGILGRDVLNHAAVLLDGPRQQWTEHTSPTPR